MPLVGLAGYAPRWLGRRLSLCWLRRLRCSLSLCGRSARCYAAGYRSRRLLAWLVAPPLFGQAALRSYVTKYLMRQLASSALPPLLPRHCHRRLHHQRPSPCHHRLRSACGSLHQDTYCFCGVRCVIGFRLWRLGATAMNIRASRLGNTRYSRCASESRARRNGVVHN